MAELGGVNRHRSSEGTLSRCPGFARFTFLEILVLELTGLGTVIQLLGLGIGLDWREYPLYIPTSRRWSDKRTIASNKYEERQ